MAEKNSSYSCTESTFPDLSDDRIAVPIFGKKLSSKINGRKSNITSDGMVKHVQQKISLRPVVSSNRRNIRGTDLPDVKSRTLPLKKRTSAQMLSQGPSYMGKRQNIGKQSMRTRPLSTDLSLSSTSPAVLRKQTEKVTRTKSNNLTHSWHGMPSAGLMFVRSNTESVHRKRSGQRRPKSNMKQKGNRLDKCA